jgi:hypothetical protein
LITERFTAPCGRHGEDARPAGVGVAWTEEGLDGLALPGVEALDSKMREELLLERVAR